VIRQALGFWAIAGALLLRAGIVVPAPLQRRPGITPRLAVVGLAFALYLAATVMTARRARAADPASAVGLVWLLGTTGLALAGTLLGLL
jgi:hypothetical protein